MTIGYTKFEQVHQAFREVGDYLNFLVSQPKHMLWVKTDGSENIYNFTHIFFCLSRAYSWADPEGVGDRGSGPHPWKITSGNRFH